MVQRSAGKAKSGRASTIEPSEIQPPLILLYTALWALFRSVGLTDSIMRKCYCVHYSIDVGCVPMSVWVLIRLDTSP